MTARRLGGPAAVVFAAAGLMAGSARRARSAGGGRADVVLAVLLAGTAFIPGSGTFGVVLGELPRRPLDRLGVALVLAQALPLALRRGRPLACLGLVAGAFAMHQLRGYPPSSASLGLYVALYSAGVHLEGRRRQAAAVGVAAYAVLTVALLAEGSPERPVDFVTFFPVLAGCCAAGAVVRARGRSEAQRRQMAAQRAVAEERVRIARELHDVVTHHVTAMVVQAEATQFVLGDKVAVGRGLAAVSDTGRSAMAELRHLLGVLDAPGAADAAGAPGESPAGPGAPGAVELAPSVRAPVGGRVQDLVARTRSAGQPVELVERGRARPTSTAVQLAVYRVVQEGLTNALKYAPGRETVVRVEHDDRAVCVEVGTGRAERPAGPAGGRAVDAGAASGGRGLTGLQERVAVLGGELRAGPRPEGGFALWARIPLEPPL